MKTTFFIKTYQADFKWLQYSLRSIQKFATGFSGVTVVVPRGEKPPTGAAEEVFEVDEYFNPYLFQQWIKLNADAYSDAEMFTFMDSDTIFTRPISPDLLLEDRKPIWHYTPYSSIPSGDGQTWKKPTEDFMGREVPNEFMRRHPMTIPRWALISFRQWVMRTKGHSLENYIRNQAGGNFSEFNCIGAYLWFYHHDRIAWNNTDENMGTCFVHQHHSYTQWNEETVRNMETALA